MFCESFLEVVGRVAEECFVNEELLALRSNIKSDHFVPERELVLLSAACILRSRNTYQAKVVTGRRVAEASGEAIVDENQGSRKVKVQS